MQSKLINYIMNKAFKLSQVLVFLFLFSCAGLENLGNEKTSSKNSQIDYLEKGAKFKVDEFLNGELSGFAIIQDEKGKIIDSFVLDVSGYWEEKKGTVKFSYQHNSGKNDARTWLITSENSESYSAIGHDFVTPASGKQIGNASKIIYVLMQDYKNKKEKITYEDNIFLADENSAIIISNVRIDKKLIAKATISLSKKPKKEYKEKDEIKTGKPE